MGETGALFSSFLLINPINEYLLLFKKVPGSIKLHRKIYCILILNKKIKA